MAEAVVPAPEHRLMISSSKRKGRQSGQIHCVLGLTARPRSVTGVRPCSKRDYRVSDCALGQRSHAHQRLMYSYVKAALPPRPSTARADYPD